eukprot:1716891-Pyramimonas_sp.AAC.1
MGRAECGQRANQWTCRQLRATTEHSAAQTGSEKDASANRQAAARTPAKPHVSLDTARTHRARLYWGGEQRSEAECAQAERARVATRAQHTRTLPKLRLNSNRADN